jgi:hypothetical protein
VEHTNVRTAFVPPCGARWEVYLTAKADDLVFSSLIGQLLHPDDFIGCPTDLFKFPVCPVAVNFLFIFNSLEKSLQFRTVWRHRKILNHFASISSVIFSVSACLSGTHFWCHRPNKSASLGDFPRVCICTSWSLAGSSGQKIREKNPCVRRYRCSSRIAHQWYVSPWVFVTPPRSHVHIYFFSIFFSWNMYIFKSFFFNRGAEKKNLKIVLYLLALNLLCQCLQYLAHMFADAVRNKKKC